MGTICLAKLVTHGLAKLAKGRNSIAGIRGSRKYRDLFAKIECSQQKSKRLHPLFKQRNIVLNESGNNVSQRAVFAGIDVHAGANLGFAPATTYRVS